jgi:hypothetical protein
LPRRIHGDKRLWPEDQGGNVAAHQGVEYHIVVAEHGALDPENMPEQIKTPHPGVQIGFLGG